MGCALFLRPQIPSLLRDFQELDFKIQRSIWWNHAGISTRTVSKISRNDKFAFATDLHSFDALIPTRNNLASTQLELKRHIAFKRTIELRPAFARRIHPAYL